MALSKDCLCGCLGAPTRHMFKLANSSSRIFQQDQLFRFQDFIIIFDYSNYAISIMPHYFAIYINSSLFIILFAFNSFTQQTTTYFMDIDSVNFRQRLPQIISRIQKADFIAFDCQFSGLTSQLGQIQGIFPNHIEFYERIKQTANNFSILQFGITTFQYRNDNYKPFVYNFYLDPKTKTLNKNQVMLSEVASLTFLVDKNMDFKRVLTRGIKHKIIGQKQDDPVFVSSIPKFSYKAMFFDQKDQKLVNEIEKTLFLPFLQSQVKDFNADFKTQSIMIYFRNKYSPNIQITNKLKNMNQFQFNVRKSRNYQYPRHLTDQIQVKQPIMENKNKQFQPQPSFEIIISKIIESGKPMVGHFPNLDLGLFYSHFIGDLPENFQDFCETVNKIFPYFFDTKVISRRLQSQVKGHINVSLKPLFDQCRFGKILKPFTNIDFSALENYIKKDNLHEAGYDSFMTGTAFIGMANYLIGDKSRINFKALANQNKVIYSRNTGEVSLQGPNFCQRSSVFQNRIIIGKKIQEKDKQEIANKLSKFGTLSVYEDHEQYYYVYEKDQSIKQIIENHKEFQLSPYSKRKIIRANKVFS